MTQREIILDFLASANGPICDDCLSTRTGITLRQAINQNCNRMAKSNEIARIEICQCEYCRASKICNSIDHRIPIHKPVAPVSKTTDPHQLWYWEGNVQSALVTWLAKNEWEIQSAADTAARSAGKDIIATLDSRTLWVSVKGYPRGTPKTAPPTQARHWFSHAVFDLVLYRDLNESTELALGLPSGFKTYQNLAGRVEWLRSHLPFTIYWVSESGEVQQE